MGTVMAVSFMAAAFGGATLPVLQPGAAAPAPYVAPAFAQASQQLARIALPHSLKGAN